MPIRNLTERPRMPRLGKIRLGYKLATAKGTEYPKGLDHFLCPADVTEALRGKVPFCEGKCKEAPGPLEIPIVFLSNDLEQGASQWFRSYKATVGLVCKGDGYKADATLDRAALQARQGDYSQPLPVELWARHDSEAVVRVDAIECWGEGYDGHEACPAYAAAKCKRLMMLQFAIPLAPGLGVFQLDTSSINSILNINGFLTFLRSLTNGRIAGIPLMLKVAPQEVTPEGKKKTVYIIHLTSAFNLPQLAEAMTKPVMDILLPAPDADDVPEGFFPDEEAAETGLPVAAGPSPVAHEAAQAPGGAAPVQHFTNVGQLYTAATRDLKFRDVPDILGALGIKGQPDVELMGLDAAWERLIPIADERHAARAGQAAGVPEG